MRSTHRKAPKSENVYLQVLVKLYRFLARMDYPRRTGLELVRRVKKLTHDGFRSHGLQLQQSRAASPVYVEDQPPPCFSVAYRLEHH